jgi:hypothetical protein
MGCHTTIARKSSLGLVKVKKTNQTTKHGMKRCIARKKNCVRFANGNDVAFRHVTHEELMTTWYQPREYESFKKDCQRTAIEFRGAQGDITRLNPDKFCLRGLETQITRASIATRRMTIASSIHMVLHEQLSQRATGQSNPERIRQVFEVMSKSARMRAFTMAAFDAKLCQLAL